MVSYFNPKKKKTVIRNQPKKPGALLFFESYRCLYWSICGFFGVLPMGCFRSVRSSKWKCKCLASGPTGRCCSKGGDVEIHSFSLYATHHSCISTVLHPKFSAVKYQSTNYGWLRLVSYYFSGYPGCDSPLECLLYAEATNSAKAPKFPFQDSLSYLIAEGWSGRDLVTDPSSST